MGEEGGNSVKVRIDEDLCTGCGLCEDTCPEVFELDLDEDVAKVIVDEVPEEYEQDCQDAAESCPVGCIEVID